MADADTIERVARVAAALATRTTELTGELVELYARELPHLANDDESLVSLLSASVYQNVDTALRIFQHGIDPRRVEAPAAAMEYARRLAQRGTQVVDLIRAYYLGQTALLEYSLREAVRVEADPVKLGAMMEHALTGAFAFIDRVTQQVVSAYQEERERWLVNRSAVRAARVRSLLAGDGADTSETGLGYRLRGTHLAMIVWQSPVDGNGHVLGGLEAVAGELAASLPSTGGPLFVPNDEVCAWVWFPLEKPAMPDEERVREVLAKAHPGIRFVLGEPGEGLDGFRQSHRQAMRVYNLAFAAGEHCDRVLTFRDVGAMALMAGDMAAARGWVADTLRELAIDDEQHARLRDTLRVFLAAGGSYTAAAGQLTMHKNSVQYRVRKAEEILGRPVSENRLDVELALRLCHRLGGAVLTTP